MNTKTEQMDSLKSKRKDMMLVDPRNLIIYDGFNIRHDLGDISSLMQSIQEFGLQVPIKAKKIIGKDQYEVVDGHRRMMAINSLIELGVEIPYVEVSVFSGDENDKLLSMLITGTGQKPLTEFEQSEGVGRLIDAGQKPETIAKKIGKSTPHIYHLLKIYSLPEKYKNKIRDGYISGYTMLELFDTYSEDELDEQLELVIADAQAQSKNGEVKKATAKNVKKEEVLKPIEKFEKLANYCKERIEDGDYNRIHVLIEEIYLSLFEEEDITQIQHVIDSWSEQTN